MRTTRVLGSLLVVGLGLAVPSSAAECAPPPLVASARASLLAPQLVQGQAIPLPVAYASVEHDTTGPVTFAEAGPLSLGVLEDQPLDPDGLLAVVGAFAPAVLPPLPPTGLQGPPPADLLGPARATAAHPSGGIPGAAQTDWRAGRSAARATPTSGVAGTSAAGLVPGLPLAGGSTEVTSIATCRGLDITASWGVGRLALGALELDGVVQTAHVSAIDGELEADVRTRIGAVRIAGVTVLSGDVAAGPLRDVLAPLSEGGQRVEVVDPIVTTSDGRVTVDASGITVQLTNPQNPGQVLQLRVGELAVELATVSPPGPTATPAPAPERPAARPTAGPSLDRAPGPPLERAAGGPATPTRTTELVSRGTAPTGVALSIGALALAVAWLLVARANRSRWPTADWAFARSAVAARRFRDRYLAW